MPFDIVGDDGMVGAKDGPEVVDPFRAAGDALLVEVISNKIDTIRIRQVVQDIAVEVGDGDARRKTARMEPAARC